MQPMHLLAVNIPLPLWWIRHQSQAASQVSFSCFFCAVWWTLWRHFFRIWWLSSVGSVTKLIKRGMQNWTDICQFWATNQNNHFWEESLAGPDELPQSGRISAEFVWINVCMHILTDKLMAKYLCNSEFFFRNRTNSNTRDLAGSVHWKTIINSIKCERQTGSRELC